VGYIVKAVFLSENPALIERVYAEKQRAALALRVELYPEILTGVHHAQACALAEAEVIFSTWGMPALNEEQIEKHLPTLNAVFYGAGSVQNFARPFLCRGARVFSAWHANAVPVIQYAVAQILLATKGYFRVQPVTRKSRKDAHALFANYPGNYDARIGLLGCGAIGSKVAEMLIAQGMEVLVFDPFLEDERAGALGVRKASLDEIFATCIVVSNHLADLPGTVGIIKREHLLSMQPYSTFINTGRGPQLCEDDLYDMLLLNPTRTALLDVMTDEGNSDTNRLNKLANCLITPHIAGASGLEVRRMGDYMIEAYDQYVAGKVSHHEVTMEMLETMA